MIKRKKYDVKLKKYNQDKMDTQVCPDSVEVNIWDFLRFSGTFFTIAGILEACILFFALILKI